MITRLVFTEDDCSQSERATYDYWKRQELSEGEPKEQNSRDGGQSYRPVARPPMFIHAEIITTDVKRTSAGEKWHQH